MALNYLFIIALFEPIGVLAGSYELRMGAWENVKIHH